MSMRTHVLTGGAALALAAWSAPAAQDPTTGGALAASNARARAAVARSIEAHGGEAALRAIDTVWLEERGLAYMRTQGPLPGRPLAARPVRNVVMLDFGRGRGCLAPDPFTHTDTTRVEEMLYVWQPKTIVRDGSVYQLDMRTRSRSAPRSGSLQALLAQQRALPSAWLLEALTAAHTLHWMGEDAASRTARVGMTGSDGRAVTLAIGETGLLTAVERLTTDPTEGDGVTSTTFSNYRRVAGVMLPGRRVGRTGSDVTSDVRYERLSVNEGIDEACLSIPESFSVWPAPGPRPETAAVKLGDGVYLLQALGDAYNALAVLFADHVLVIEAPENETPSGLSAQALRLVAGISGGRPIRYFAFTHFHTDHGGGVRDYIAEGATILATASTKTWVEQVATTRFEIVPDRLARQPRAPSVRVVEDRFVLEDATQRVEFHMVPWDHAREEFVFYLPKARLLFEGDLFASGQGETPVAQRVAELLARTIRERGLAVETIVGVHGKPRPIGDLDKAIERRRHVQGS
jgi:glyoxylase-like metal-dependent hydrolase (beta-lactamase superfamily II)